MQQATSKPVGNPKVLGWVGMLLFLLGIVSYALVHASASADAGTVRLAAGTGVLMSLAVSSIVISALRRLEDRVAALESRPRD